MASTPGTYGMGLVGPVGFYLADDGGGNKVFFVGASAPYPIPYPTAEYQTELYTMRRGSGGPGYRAAQIDGSAVGYQDVEWPVVNVTPAMLTAMNLKYYADPPIALEYSPDGTNKFVAVFKKPDGWTVTNWEEKHTQQSGKVKINVLAQL